MEGTLQDFIALNKDYPNVDQIRHVELCYVSDQDIPSGNRGINREGYTYGKLRREPIINELLKRIDNVRLAGLAKACNDRNLKLGFQMFKVNGAYCFWSLRVGPVVEIPNFEQMQRILANQALAAPAVANKCVTADMVRKVTYNLLHQEVAEECNISIKEAAYAIGNQLDCAPHEDPSGYIFMVPNWAHNWFRHKGYVSQMVKDLNK
ncbi:MULTISPECIES: hypothetical protein [Sphingobacterium]|jgi:hypothetical protein|uniref:hypothetical protein n=1 Tax=Sphingobacterium TaxID=28453 RepID=UPI00257AA854|nr:MULTISPECIES: hypothetical protein [Sphingobacterium]MDF2849856.1 hypothetical protein [Sphingobacterium multivorum]